MTDNMVGKASYWHHFKIDGNKAHCLLGGYKTPCVSVGKESIEGQPKPKTGKALYHYNIRILGEGAGLLISILY